MQGKSGRDRHADKLRKTLGFHLRHHVGAVHFHRAGADVEIIGDRLVRQARDNGRQNLAFAVAQAFQP